MIWIFGDKVTYILRSTNFSPQLHFSQETRKITGALEKKVCVCMCVCVLSLKHIWLFVTSWTVASQAPLPMVFPKQEFWSGLPFSPPGDLPDPGIKCASLGLLYCRADTLSLCHLGMPWNIEHFPPISGIWNFLISLESPLDALLKDRKYVFFFSLWKTMGSCKIKFMWASDRP